MKMHVPTDELLWPRYVTPREPNGPTARQTLPASVLNPDAWSHAHKCNCLPALTTCAVQTLAGILGVVALGQVSSPLPSMAKPVEDPTKTFEESLATLMQCKKVLLPVRR